MDTLLRRCATLDLPHVKQFQAHLLTAGHFQFFPTRSKLIELCAISPAGDLSFARQIFHHIQTPSTNDWNAVLRGLALSPHPSDAVSWYRTMLRNSRRVDALTASFTLKACARILSHSETSQLHSQIVRRGFIADALLGTTLLDVYAKVGEIDYAKKVFDEMIVRDIASWNALISGLAQGNQASEALELFQRMEIEGLNPNGVTVLGALAACSHLGAFKEGEKIHEYIESTKLDNNVIVCNAVIDMYAKCGLVDKASMVFENMSCKKNLITWNTMIMGYAMHGHGSQALKLFKQMSLNGIHPDDVSYLAVLSACNHAGLVEDGVELFDSMPSQGVNPNVKHYATIVDILGRAGRLNEAYDIITSMPMMPDVILWQTLLGASQLYQNIEMAEIASNKLSDLGSNNCGDFVLMSNVYARNGRWNDVGKVRDAMKKKDVTKVPGFSCIEVDGANAGAVHKFFTGDKNHSNWREIYRKLEEIRFKIREFGYIAETKLVLHDIGEEDKENALCYHSEKLALAFGLLATQETSVIRVFKNLRICGDCHVVFKLVSEIYKREIIVRDRVRFHRFSEGSCSCRDYW